MFLFTSWNSDERNDHLRVFEKKAVFYTKLFWTKYGYIDIKKKSCIIRKQYNVIKSPAGTRGE